jgi:hypothetical protein
MRQKFNDKWVPVTMVWRVLRLWIKERPPIWRVAANTLNKQTRKPHTGDPPAGGLSELLTTHHKEGLDTKGIQVPRATTDPLV